MTKISGTNKFLNASALRRWVKLERITFDVQRIGVERGFIDATDVVRFALARLNAHVDVGPEEEEVALLLSDELSRFPELLARFPEPDRELASRVWAFAGLAQVRSVWTSLAQPWEQVADVVETLGEPKGYSGLIYYEIVPLFSRAPGLAGLLTKLDSALAEDASVFGV